MVIPWAFGRAVGLRLGSDICVVRDNPFPDGDPRHTPTADFLDTIDGGGTDARGRRRIAHEFRRCWEPMLPATVLAVLANEQDWLAAMYGRRTLMLIPEVDALHEG
ncbi:MAG: hypothetical protein ACTHMJ_19530 [Thermomicrobiales bacterium]